MFSLPYHGLKKKELQGNDAWCATGTSSGADDSHSPCGPLDVTFMAPLSTYYQQEVRQWLATHPGRAVSIQQVAKLYGAAFPKAAGFYSSDLLALSFVLAIEKVPELNPVGSRTSNLGEPVDFLAHSDTVCNHSRNLCVMAREDSATVARQLPVAAYRITAMLSSSQWAI
ncbi:hypothetical protein JTB14_027713 [Gonioctena quinquepunctata]|nr:hypothetical protein JTB14_027713 [Gonioctena quinquepunctata]